MLFILPWKSQADHHQAWGTPGEVHEHECLFHWIHSDLPLSSGVKFCALNFSENREAIHLTASFANLITRPQASSRGPWHCKRGSYTSVTQGDSVLGKRLHPRQPSRRWRGAKIYNGEGWLQCFAALTVHWFGGTESKQCLHVKRQCPKLPIPWHKLSEHWSDILHFLLALAESKPQLI